tara:strand:+ start:659 stop:808 length:150 start_codon:yes stop_codon:yes gene_type:complete
MVAHPLLIIGLSIRTPRIGASVLCINLKSYFIIREDKPELWPEIRNPRY